MQFLVELSADLNLSSHEVKFFVILKLNVLVEKVNSGDDLLDKRSIAASNHIVEKDLVVLFVCLLNGCKHVTLYKLLSPLEPFQKVLQWRHCQVKDID